MSTQDPRIQHALKAWEAWNHLGFVNRSDRLKKLSAELPQTRDASIKSLLRTLLDLSITLEPIHVMPGPTGESNELYLNGRGVALVIGDNSASKTA
ncbi:MAG: 1-pyrroline-5-carboxylate dehydrogenase, partial [Oceanospirillales bacterium]